MKNDNKTSLDVANLESSGIEPPITNEPYVRPIRILGEGDLVWSKWANSPEGRKKMADYVRSCEDGSFPIRTTLEPFIGKWFRLQESEQQKLLNNLSKKDDSGNT